MVINMEFKITLGENFPCLDELLPRIDVNLILADCNRFDNDCVVNGLIGKISHPGGVNRVVSDKGSVGFYESEPRPDSTNKLTVLLQVLRDEFTLTQENGGLILYMEGQQSAGRNLPYYAVILPFENVAIVVCDEYGQGTRIKKYDSEVTSDYIRNEIQDNYRKGDLDDVGFTMNPVPAGGYESEAILYQYFTSLIKDDVARIETICSARAEMVDAVLGADPDTSTGFNQVVECDEDVELNQLKSQLRDRFNGGDGFLDLSKITYENINALKKEFGIGASAIATRLNVDFPKGANAFTPSSFAYVLLRVYDSFKNYAPCEESIKRLNILIDPEFLKAALMDYFNGDDGVLDLKKITERSIGALYNEYGIGPAAIATRLNVELPGNINVKTPSSFAHVLKVVYESSENYAGCEQSIRKLNVLTDTKCLKAALRDYFNGEDGVLDLSKITQKNIKALKKEFGIGPTAIVARLNIELPEDVYVQSLTGFAHVLKVVYESSENYAGCEQSIRKLNVLTDTKCLKAALRDYFNGEDGVLDVSKITSKNISDLVGEFGIGPKVIATRLNIELPEDVNVVTPSGFAHVLLMVYDYFEGYDRCEKSIKWLNVLTDPECLKAALRDYFNGGDGLLDLSKITEKNIRALYKEYGIGPAAIATRLNVELPEMLTVKYPSGFVRVLKVVYESSENYAGCEQSQICLNQMAVKLGVSEVFDSEQ
jgi:Mg2+ and Co2+ transporter CorA